MCDHDVLIACHQGEKPEIPQGCNPEAIIVTGNSLHLAGISGDGFWCSPQPLDNPFSIGSGQDHAITAMDMGADAKTAVKMAMKRDVATGGKVRTFKVR